VSIIVPLLVEVLVMQGVDAEFSGHYNGQYDFAPQFAWSLRVQRSIEGPSLRPALLRALASERVRFVVDWINADLGIP